MTFILSGISLVFDYLSAPSFDFIGTAVTDSKFKIIKYGFPAKYARIKRSNELFPIILNYSLIFPAITLLYPEPPGSLNCGYGDVILFSYAAEETPIYLKFLHSPWSILEPHETRSYFDFALIQRHCSMDHQSAESSTTAAKLESKSFFVTPSALPSSHNTFNVHSLSEPHDILAIARYEVYESVCFPWVQLTRKQTSHIDKYKLECCFDERKISIFAHTAFTLRWIMMPLLHLEKRVVSLFMSLVDCNSVSC
jgi:hypothetical protein